MENNNKNLIVLIFLVVLLISLPVLMIVVRQRQEIRKKASEPPILKSCYLCENTTQAGCKKMFDVPSWKILDHLDSPKLAAVRKTETGNDTFITWACPAGTKAIKGRVMVPNPADFDDTVLCGFVENQSAPKTREFYDPAGRVSGLIRCNNIRGITEVGIDVNKIKEVRVRFFNVPNPMPTPPR